MSWYDTLLFWCCLFVIDNADYSVIRYDTLLLTYSCFVDVLAFLIDDVYLVTSRHFLFSAIFCRKSHRFSTKMRKWRGIEAVPPQNTSRIRRSESGERNRDSRRLRRGRRSILAYTAVKA